MRQIKVYMQVNSCVFFLFLNTNFAKFYYCIVVHILLPFNVQIEILHIPLRRNYALFVTE